MDNSLMHDDPDRLACLPLAQLDRLLYRNAIKQPSVKVLFNHKVCKFASTGNGLPNLTVLFLLPH